MKHKLKEMFEMQSAINTKVDPNWRTANYDWYRAIWIETAELADHYGYKWWKKQTPDLDQVKLELVDIWHFGLSLMMVDVGRESRSIYEIVEMLVDTYGDVMDAPFSHSDFLLFVDNFAEYVLTNEEFSMYFFFQMMKKIGMTFDELYIHYIAKNVLNTFRQDNGYKEGEYVKDWDGKEDNEVLMEIVKDLDINDVDFSKLLYLRLGNTYNHIKQEN